jgi:VanZ family protein
MNCSQDDAGCSIEVWVKPERKMNTGTILVFDNRLDGQLFSVSQEWTDLVVRRESRGGPRRTDGGDIHVDTLFHAQTPILLTIASGAHGTAVYADGSLVKVAPGFRLSHKDLQGQLILGDSAVQSDGWPGELLGLAFYPQDLTAGQVLRHYSRWIESGRPDRQEPEKPSALYLFDEHMGAIAHSTLSTVAALYIPDRYSIVDKTVLEAPWKAFRPTWNYWQDVAINIGGFIPLGLLAGAYLSLTIPARWVAPGTIALGGAISLTIESLQVFLPTRNSDLTDVLTNTLGTCMGVAMLRWNPAHRAIGRLLDLSWFAARQPRIGSAN